MALRTILKRDDQRHEGVRLIEIYLLRTMFLLIVLFVGYDSWTAILSHDGSWDHVRAAAVCMWAAFAVLAIIGVFHPLKMLPLVLFEILYKVLWLVVVAYPLWATGRLSESPAAEMTYAFMWVILPILAMPWKYAWQRFVMNRFPQ